VTEDYSKMGVTPVELYMRQQGTCWLLPVVDEEGKVILYCSDGIDRALAAALLNPTPECVKCMVRYATKLTQDIIDDKSTGTKDPPISKDT